ncbi:MAG TPA: hypothetical protein PKX15_06665 [Bacteroidales bacterium]|nr:hypothetical protein [Bacteroidales bacterium]
MKNEKETFAWKVVRVTVNNNYISAWYTSDVIYKLNKWTYSTGGWGLYPFLYVFKSRQNARDWCQHLKKINPQYTYRVFKCEVRNPTTSRCFLYSDKTRFISSSETCLPAGTLFVDAVRLM